MAFLELAMIRNVLLKNKCNDATYESVRYVQKNLAKKNENIYKFMLEIITLAVKDIERDKFKLASFDINLIHNFPSKTEEIKNWENEEAAAGIFFKFSLPEYLYRLLEVQEYKKAKKVLALVDQYLYEPCSTVMHTNYIPFEVVS
ncbi:hypothetical protein BN3087_950003 [Sulfurovum sp. enrichment culture clone C5]|uniref:Uncharacterized protein n=1 Tax=Sulfurovum sp. enrichment culture clone C5 TaxID=497650 RepID=A0A0S4XQN3_9BACT|nr:hypothetical protein BN3087_950003 [Sulfurovum sp. enrichment culture clone C5]